MSTITFQPQAGAESVSGTSSSSRAEADSFHPDPVEELEDTGLPESLVVSLIFKYLLQVGESAGRACASALCLPSRPVLDILSNLKNRRLVVYKDSSSMGDFIYVLTEEGRDVAKRHLCDNSYMGPAPVLLSDYVRSVAAQTIEGEKPRIEQLREAFSDLLINEEMFERLGPAICSARGMLLFGEPGNGKSSIAERTTKCFGSPIWIPKAIYAEGVIINFVDPGTHEPVQDQPSPATTPNLDTRWVRIKRPTIVVGGELTMDALELRYTPGTGITEPSLQLKSNCGTLVIDDFGRQRVNPDELLNRWIVPLEKRHDYLTLHTGKKICVPFDQLIIFSTNLEPRDLVDEAFLRRIPYKVNVRNPTEQEFRRLFGMMCEQLGIAYEEGAISYLIQKWYKECNRHFRCCHPRDLLLQILNRAAYAGVEAKMTPESFDKACDCYFAML
jgi:predicted ATPase with chaperone activity